jgi:hypothetical protein
MKVFDGKIDEPGLYLDMPEAAYHADPCPGPSLSHSVAVALLDQSPQHAFAMHPKLGGGTDHDRASALDIGAAIHASLTGTFAALHVIDAPDYRTRDAQTQRASAWEAGKTPLLRHQFAAVEAAVEAAIHQIAAHEIANDWTAGSSGGKGEVTVAWIERVGDFEFWCRARIDWLPNEGPVFYDLKTTAGTADPETWVRRLFDGGYDVQAAFYRRGLRAVGQKRTHARFVVLEQKPPHALSVVAMDPEATALADEKVERALRVWAACLQSGRWPGYPNRVCYAEAPPWEQTKNAMRKERHREAVELHGDALHGALHWQAPARAKDAA